MKIKNITHIAIFSALICILSTIAIPSPFGVPFTLQTFSVSLAGFVLGKKYGTICILIYLLLGSIGLPVFSGLTGGLGRFVSVTGGFLYGFIFLSFFSGYGNIFTSIIGLIICHIIGILQFSLLTKNNFLSSFAIASLPYIIKDLISIFFAYFISKKLIKIIF